MGFVYTVCIKKNYTLVGSPPKFILYDIHVHDFSS